MKRYLYLVLCLGFFTVSAGSLALQPSIVTGSALPAQQGTLQSPLSISKVAYPGPALYPGLLFYTVTVYNSGPVTLTNVAISDTLPTGTVLEAAHPCFLPGYGHIAYCVGLTIPPNHSQAVWFGIGEYTGPVVVNEQYAVGAPGVPPAFGAPVAVPVVTRTPGVPPPPTPPSYPGPTATPLASPTATLPPPATAIREPTPTPAGMPRLVISQASPTGTTVAGGVLTLHFVVTNDGTGMAHNVVLSAQVPAGLQAQEVTIDPPAAIEWTGNTLWVAWDSLAPGTSATVELQAIVLPDAASDLEVVVGLPDYGAESRAALELAPAVLPGTGAPTMPWWGWAALVMGLLFGGLFLRQFITRERPR